MKKSMNRFNCPCCGYQTLSEIGGYEICKICNWEDDGFDDEHEVSGPNGCTLIEARLNFKDHLDMYKERKRNRIEQAYTEKCRSVKRKLIKVFDEIKHTSSDDALNSLWRNVFTYEKELDALLSAYLDELEQSEAST